MRSNDLHGVAAFYADDGILLSPRGSRVSGRQEIDRYWSEFGRGIDWKLSIASLEGGEGVVCHRGTSQLTYERDGKRRTSTVQYMLIWKPTAGGSWKIAVDAYW